MFGRWHIIQRGLTGIRKEWLLSGTVYFGFLLLFWFSLPDPLFRTPTSYLIESREGVLLGARVAADGQWRFPPGADVPEKFSKAIIAFEDKRFYSHPGFDILALGRAFFQNIKAGSIESGGSTLSMQVIRLSRNKPRTIWQKCLEIMLAVRLELTYSKEEVLALYARNAPFGGNVVGLEAASWRYFGRSPEQLSWGETAALAVLPNSPSLVYPGKNSKALLLKRNRLLEKLSREGLIDPLTGKLAMQEPLPGEPLDLPQSAPHLLTRFYKEHGAAAGKNSKDPVSSLTTRARTTLSASLQEKVTDIIALHHRRLKANGVNNAAALVLEVETGAALAYVGNVYAPEDPEVESYVDVIPAPRSPGSTLKPILYAAMLSEGMLLPNTLVADIPTRIAGFTPHNFDLEYSGAVPAGRALSRSLNIPAVKMLQQYRYERFHSLLKRMGLTTLDRPPGHYGLSLILGGGEVSMWDLAGIYASMARVLNHQYDYSGRYDPADFHAPLYLAPRRADDGLVENDGKPGKTDKHLEKNGLLDAAGIWFSFRAMEEVVRPGEEMLWRQFTSTQQVAWKTGTSFGFRDGWAIGITPRYVVAVWAGNADGEGRAGLTGITAAAPVLFDIFRLLPAASWFQVPYDKLARIKVCARSGYRASELCTGADGSYVPRAGLRTGLCPYHQLVHLDASGTHRVTGDCLLPSAMVHQSWFILPPAMEWYYKDRNQDYRPLPPYAEGCNPNTGNSEAMAFIYPSPGTKIYIPVELNGKRGETVFSAAHRRPAAKIYWHLDGEYLGVTSGLHEMALSPDAGRHTITLVDEQGERLSGGFEILDK